MARTKARLAGDARLADYLTVGYLAMNCPVDRVRQALAAQGVQSRRRRGLPHEVLVYFVMAMVLYADVAYDEVLRLVIEGLHPLLGDERLGQVAVTKGAISQARGKVGAEPLRALYHEQVRPQGPVQMPGKDYRGLRVMALDGSTLDMPDESANAAYFGYPSASSGSSAFPKLRFVALAECGTHTLCFAEPGPYSAGERQLAEAVLDRADASMLITAERGFYSYALWQRSCASGARLLFRVRRDLLVPREQNLADGSYLTTLYPSAKARRHRADGVVARVVEYRLEGVADAEPSYRLITNWLEPEAAPAEELAALYHRRWTIEQAFDELKVHLAGRAVVLRSKRPELVEQEFYALLLAHAAVRRLITQAAAANGQVGEDLSFIHAVRVLRRRLPSSGAIPP